jgi:hypothetical protein
MRRRWPRRPDQCCRKKVPWKPEEDQPEGGLAEAEEPLAAAQVRQPVVEPGEHREDEAADQDIVQVGGDEGVSCTCQSKGTMATMTPVSPPITKVAKKPRIQSIGMCSSGRPFQIVPIQAKTCIAVGTATSVEAAEKKRERHVRDAGDEHVVDPEPEAQEPQRHAAATTQP